MLAPLVFVMAAIFMFLIMTRRPFALIALILVPIVFVLVDGFAAGLDPVVPDGIRTLASISMTLMFAILYFAIMIDSGLFDPVVCKILRLIKGDPLKALLGTAVLAMIVSLDGDDSTTYMIYVATVPPLYSRLGMSPLVMACPIILPSGILNMTPWGSPTMRVTNALHVDLANIFVSTISTMITELLATFVIAWICGKRERVRLDELHLPTDHEDLAEISVLQYPEAYRPRLLWFNAILTVVLMATLITDLLSMSMLFIIAFDIIMIINYSHIQEQKKRTGMYAENTLVVVLLILVAGVLTGILSDIGITDAMSKSLLAVVPPALGPCLMIITALANMPFTFSMSNDAFYYSVLPILTQAAAEYGITPVEMARTSTVGQPVHLLSPLVSSTCLLVGLTKIDFGNHQHFILKWVALVCLVILAMALLLGLLPLLNNWPRRVAISWNS